MANAVEAYRTAAMKLYGITRKEAEAAIVAARDDRGGWAPDADAIIYLENGDMMAAHLDYWGNGLEESCRFSDAVGRGFIEHINAAVCAVYDFNL